MWWDNLQPPSRFSAVTPSDTTDISALATRGLYVSATGTVYIQGVNDARRSSRSGAKPREPSSRGASSASARGSSATVVACGN